MEGTVELKTMGILGTRWSTRYLLLHDTELFVLEQCGGVYHMHGNVVAVYDVPVRPDMRAARLDILITLAQHDEVAPRKDIVLSINAPSKHTKDRWLRAIVATCEFHEIGSAQDHPRFSQKPLDGLKVFRKGSTMPTNSIPAMTETDNRSECSDDSDISTKSREELEQELVMLRLMLAKQQCSTDTHVQSHAPFTAPHSIPIAS